MKKISALNRKKIILIILAVVLIAGGTGGYILMNRSTATKARTTQTASTMKTTEVKRGDLTVSVSGSGSVVASKTVKLSFLTEGVVKNVNVQPGDKVDKGQLLAELENVSTLEAAVSLANANLASAKKSLEDYKSASTSNLGNAQLTLATAQKSLTDAKSKMKTSTMVRCDEDMTQAYYDTYFRLKNKLTDLGDGGGNPDYLVNVLVPARNEVTKAYDTYIYCAGYTSYEVDASRANITLAEAAVKTAQENLDTLKANNGLDPVGLAEAQNTVDNAQMAYETAMDNLDAAALKAPFAGTVISVAGDAGDYVDTTTFINVSDLDNPMIQFYVDETDLENVSIGNKVEVTFDAIPKKTFTGTVARVYPTLETVSNYLALKALAQLDLSGETQTYPFSSGMNASVQVIKGSVQNALLVPVEAVRDLGDGQYGVFVLNAKKTPELKVVEVGLQDVTTAEIKAGLSEGDVITTGITETK